MITVTQLNEYIKSVFDAQPTLENITVAGEASNYRVYPSGHHYFTLKDAGGVLRCVMFKSDAARLGFKPADGLQLQATGRVSVYPRDGAYQLYCKGLKKDGEGDLAAAFEALKQKLDAAGLFRQKRKLPEFPRKIAVITSPAGAAVRDVLRILRERWPLCEVCVIPTRVQGDEAPPEIVAAIEFANAFDLADLLIVGRGGGSAEDLWAFNDERVARALFNSKIPTISAVGHEPDVTIADYVADLRAATPSNAAELAVPDQIEWLQSIDASVARMGNILTRAINSAARLISPDRLRVAAENAVSGKRRDLEKFAAKLDALSPLKVLTRGYAAADLKSAADAKIGAELNIRLADGKIKSTIVEVELFEKAGV